MTTAECIHVYENSRLQSENFTPEAVTAAYVAGLAALQEKMEREAPPPQDVYYCPMAVTQDGEKLFTYDSVLTQEEALRQFSIWEDHYGYKIKEAWIDRTDGKRIEVARRWVEVTESVNQ